MNGQAVEDKSRDPKGYTFKPITKAELEQPLRPNVAHVSRRSTYSVVELPVSPETYAEIKYLLEQAGYDQCFMASGGIDLSGIALTRKGK